MGSVWRLEKPRNEMDRIYSYAPGTPERELLLQQLDTLAQRPEEIPLIIGERAPANLGARSLSHSAGAQMGHRRRVGRVGDLG
jgi:hypothetical protein